MKYKMFFILLLNVLMSLSSCSNIKKIGDFIRRRVRLYNSYIKMTKEELMKELLTGYDNENWFGDE